MWEADHQAGWSPRQARRGARMSRRPARMRAGWRHAGPPPGSPHRTRMRASISGRVTEPAAVARRCLSGLKSAAEFPTITTRPSTRSRSRRTWPRQQRFDILVSCRLDLGQLGERPIVVDHVPGQLCHRRDQRGAIRGDSVGPIDLGRHTRIDPLDAGLSDVARCAITSSCAPKRMSADTTINNNLSVVPLRR